MKKKHNTISIVTRETFQKINAAKTKLKIVLPVFAEMRSNVKHINDIECIKLNDEENTIFFPDSLNINADEFNFHLNAVIISHQNLINRNGLKVC